MIECPVCNGDGYVPCGYCVDDEGYRTVITELCQECLGTGTTKEELNKPVSVEEYMYSIISGVKHD